MKKKLVYFLILIPLFSNAQTSTDSLLNHFSPAFSNHLFDNKLYNDLFSYLNLFQKNNSLEYNLMKEKFLFENKIYAAEKIKWQPTCDSCFSNSKLLVYQKLNQMHNAFDALPENIAAFYKQQQHEKLWTSLSFKTDEQNATQDFLLLTKNLLIHDSIAFKKNEQSFQNKYPKLYLNSIEVLDDTYKDLQQIKNKKAWKAAVMSAIVPGSGKIYNGQKWQGISAFVTLAVIGLQAYDGFHKKGANSIHGWAYTGLFSIFYVGNIWGSALSVKVKQRKAYENLHSILLDNADRIAAQF